MRRYGICTAFCLFTAMILCLVTAGGDALSHRGVQEEIRHVSVCLADDEEAREEAWWHSLREGLPESVAGEVEQIREGEVEIGFEYLFGLLWRGVREESGGMLRTLFLLVGVTVLGGVAGLLIEESSSLKKPLGLVVSVSTALALWSVVADTMTRMTALLGDLTRFAESFTPVMAAVLAAGGATGGATLTSGGFAMVTALVEILVGRVLAPLIAVSFAFSLVGCVSDGLPIDGITANLKSIFMTVLGVVGVTVGGALALQSVLTAASDSMALRTARYTIGNMIPFVGGTIGAALGTLGSSLTVIKSRIGVGAVVACLLLILPQLVSLYLVRLSVSLSGAFARMMGFRTGEKLLGDFRSVFDMTLAVSCLAGVLFLLYLAAFLKTALPLCL